MTSKSNADDRAADELAIHMIRERDKGVPPVALAKFLGRTSQFVSTATNRVADADMAHDPEAVGAYSWRRGVGRR